MADNGVDLPETTVGNHPESSAQLDRIERDLSLLASAIGNIANNVSAILIKMVEWEK